MSSRQSGWEFKFSPARLFRKSGYVWSELFGSSANVIFSSKSSLILIYLYLLPGPSRSALKYSCRWKSLQNLHSILTKRVTFCALRLFRIWINAIKINKIDWPITLWHSYCKTTRVEFHSSNWVMADR
jgi:hypothetical protein